MGLGAGKLARKQALRLKVNLLVKKGAETTQIQLLDLHLLKICVLKVFVLSA
jgi:hypothetical protein